MSKNTGIKVTLVILVVVCLIQMFGISGLKSEIDELRYSEEQMRQRVVELELDLGDFQTRYYEENYVADVELELNGPDWESGNIEFEFTVTPQDLTDNTRVLVDNTIETVELKKSGSSFVGVVKYPIDEETYETTYYVYDGDKETGSEVVEWLGARQWAEKIAYGQFDGVTTYGNGKLTMAGLVAYSFNVDEKIKNAKLVFMDNVIKLDASKEGMAEINFSEEISVDDNGEFEELYIEFETEAGDYYKIYPYVSAALNYKLGEDMSESGFIYQDEGLAIDLKDGKKYSIGVIF